MASIPPRRGVAPCGGDSRFGGEPRRRRTAFAGAGGAAGHRRLGRFHHDRPDRFLRHVRIFRRPRRRLPGKRHTAVLVARLLRAEAVEFGRHASGRRGQRLSDVGHSHAPLRRHHRPRAGRKRCRHPGPRGGGLSRRQARADNRRRHYRRLWPLSHLRADTRNLPGPLGRKSGGRRRLPAGIRPRFPGDGPGTARGRATRSGFHRD